MKLCSMIVQKGGNTMEIKSININELKPFKNNPKSHPKAQIKKIENSIKEFGFNVPLVIDKEKNIITGHGRYLAAKNLKIETIPCILKSDLSEDQVKAYRLADNRVAESEWDMQALKLEFQELDTSGYNLEMTGFDIKEIKSIKRKKKELKKVNEVDKLGKLVVECPNCGHKFERKTN